MKSVSLLVKKRQRYANFVSNLRHEEMIAKNGLKMKRKRKNALQISTVFVTFLRNPSGGRDSHDRFTQTSAVRFPVSDQI